MQVMKLIWQIFDHQWISHNLLSMEVPDAILTNKFGDLSKCKWNPSETACTSLLVRVMWTTNINLQPYSGNKTVVTNQSHHDCEYGQWSVVDVWGWLWGYGCD